MSTSKQPDFNMSTNHLNPKDWEHVNRALVCKAISEFAHELLLIPTLKKGINEHTALYYLTTDSSEFTYSFIAKKQLLDHWDIDTKSLKKEANKEEIKIDALHFILEFKDSLGIPTDMLPTYLEEIASTLTGAAYKRKNQQFSAKQLVHSSFQDIEISMTEGHPCFVANNGRIGFNSLEYEQYAPEANNPFQIVWLAGHKSKATFTAIKGLTYDTLLQQELGLNNITKFKTKLQELDLNPDNYIFIPVHPWQWTNKLIPIFSADIANTNLVFLGKSNDDYSAQQSIRTLYNKTHPYKYYTKTALSILNMGFMRGLSPYYMQSTPAITDWITQLLEKDTYLKNIGFTMLGEIATVGYRNEHFEILGKSNSYNKMLSALWRESPHSKVADNQQLMTMASFLHVDNQGESFLKHIIDASKLTTKQWLQNYINVYLTPLIHCFYTYELIFMPHGENLIMVLENHVPVKVLMKDITEEVIVFDENLILPEKVKRLYTKTSDKMKVLSIFTDVFDCFFRFMSSIIATHLNFSETSFWELVAICIYDYQATQPQLTHKFETYDLFAPEFDRCCLNRLQLRNTKQMLDLANPIDSLSLVGTLQNPLAKHRRLNKQSLTTTTEIN